MTTSPTLRRYLTDQTGAAAAEFLSELTPRLEDPIGLLL